MKSRQRGHEQEDLSMRALGRRDPRQVTGKGVWCNEINPADVAALRSALAHFVVSFADTSRDTLDRLPVARVISNRFVDRVVVRIGTGPGEL